MIFILIALLALVGLGFYVYFNTSDRSEPALNMFGFTAIALGFAGLLFYSFAAFDYFAAEYKMNIINREYGTQYTQLEVFYASDVIDTIRELDRTRIEANGDVLKR